MGQNMAIRLGEGTAFIRNAHHARADGHAQVRYDNQ
jgi:hypothetical protein